MVRDAELGKQRADKLVKVRRLDGQIGWLLIHVEVQGQRDSDLPRRMYQYHHRIADRFGRPVVSLAVLADAYAEWRPGHYEEGLWGCHLVFKYPVCKLLDLGLDPMCLERSDNPVAVVIAAHLAAQATVGDLPARHGFKRALTRRLYERGYERQEVLELFRLIDWLLVLPKELEVAFRRELMEYEQEKAMPYVTSIERLGRQEGRQEGLQEGLIQDILEVLEVRFGPVPDALRVQIESLGDVATLRKLHRQALLAASLAHIQAELDKKA